MKNCAKILSVAALSLILLTGCGKSAKQQIMTCTRTLNQNGVKMDFTYKAYYTKDYRNYRKCIKRQ